MNKKTNNILFVCLGNICRSPAAEGVFKKLAADAGLDMVIDSAGTAGWHSGEPADARMRNHAKARGYSLDSVARQFNPAVDFEKFDWIITMDDQNYLDLQSMDREGAYTNKLKRMVDFCSQQHIKAVPDPYYGGPEGFEQVIDILEDACGGLLEELRGRNRK